MITISPRLMTAVGYVRGRGHLLCDVGTDHAYLPIYLCQSGKLTPTVAANGEALCAVASDINRGPVDRANIHISSAGLAGRIRTLRTDGLNGLDAYMPSDIIIFGMGGELIASILAQAPWIRREGMRLIMQPMTHPEKLRAYLVEVGFAIVGETLSVERMGHQGERIYQTVCADYDPAAVTPMSPAELLTGRCYVPEQKELYARLVQKTLATETARRNARAAAGRETPTENALIEDLQKVLENL